MQDPEDIFKTRCKMALCLIVLLVTCSQGLIQYTLHGQEEVGEIINIAGRQRMYSQAIVKEAQFIYYARDIRTHNKHTEALQEVLDRWQTAHAVVVTYRVEEIFDANAQELDGMYAVLQTHHEAMQQAADSLRLARFRPGVTARPVIDTALSHLLAAEGPYLAQMEMIVGHYARAAKSEIRAIQQLGAGVLGITIVFLFFAGWFVSRPVKRTQGVLPLDLVAKGPQSLVNVADVTKPDVDVPEPKEDNTAYDGILAAVANAVLVSKPDGTVAWANDAYYAMTGYAPDEIVGVHVRNLYPEDSLNFDTLWAAVLAGEHWHGEITSGREDGTFYTREETITPILDVEGQLKHVVSIKNDVSNRKRQEVRVMHGQKMESVGQLAAGIAHEINTPMQYVGDNTQFLMDALQDVFETNNALQKVLTLAKEH
ncbi:MAG: PAS domain S-box protein, partial [Bacteroidota bacterium]